MSVCSKAWPRCREPVTFGGGMTMVYGGLVALRVGGEVTALTQRSYSVPSTSAGTNVCGSSGADSGRCGALMR